MASRAGWMSLEKLDLIWRGRDRRWGLMEWSLEDGGWVGVRLRGVHFNCFYVLSLVTWASACTLPMLCHHPPIEPSWFVFKLSFTSMVLVLSGRSPYLFHGTIQEIYLNNDPTNTLRKNQEISKTDQNLVGEGMSKGLFFTFLGVWVIIPIPSRLQFKETNQLN